MPYIITSNELSGIAQELEGTVAELPEIWNDKQYSYFCEKYAEPLVRDLKDMEDKVDEYVLRIFNYQTRLEGL